MPKRTKNELDEQRQKFLSLKQLTQTKGWPLLQKMLTDEFHEALDTVSAPKSAKAEVEARGVIKFIKKLTDTLNSEMGFGRIAQEEYVKDYINPPKNRDEESA